jgi:hypothetical protein
MSFRKWQKAAAKQDGENQFLPDMFRRFGLNRAGGGLHELLG